MIVDTIQTFELPKISDNRGSLTFIESSRHIPFEIKRIFYIYDVQSGTDRGAHAHKELHQVIICLSGGLDVHLDDGRVKRTIHINRPWVGLHVPPMVWASEGSFDQGTVYLVLASRCYDESDYIRSYEEFINEVGNAKK